MPFDPRYGLTKPVQKSEAVSLGQLSSVLKSNPYHDAGGEFTSKDKAHTAESVRQSTQVKEAGGGAYHSVHAGSGKYGTTSKITGQEGQNQGKTVWSGTHPASNTVLGEHKTQTGALLELAGVHAKHLNAQKTLAEDSAHKEGRGAWTTQDYKNAQASLFGSESRAAVDAQHMKPHYEESAGSSGRKDKVRLTVDPKSELLHLGNSNRGSTYYHPDDIPAVIEALTKAHAAYSADKAKADAAHKENHEKAFSLWKEAESRGKKD